MRHGRNDRTILLALALVALGTVAYRIIPLFEPGRPPAGPIDFIAPLAWILPIAIVAFLVRRQTIHARLADSLCAYCERPLTDLDHPLDDPCPRCGRVNRAIAARWLIRTPRRGN